MRQLYPISAIVAQDDLLLALTICAVSPNIGGVLIRGDKGSAKSTAARAIAEVMPAIAKRPGCRYNCETARPAETCEVCQASSKGEVQIRTKSVSAPAPFVNLPLGVTEESLIGTLDLNKMLTKSEKAFQPGLLAASNRGVLYIDEVNLLADHLVDLLLDAAAMGVNVVEREGFSISHPAKITLIGTMNPEEGELRPQLLDRFGLMVDVKAPTDANTRAQVVRRRMSFDKAPSDFCKQYEAAQTELSRRIEKARELVQDITLSDPLLLVISTICAEMGIASLRADIVLGQVAKTIAALDGRAYVIVADLSTAARFVLPHRKRAKSGDRCGIDESQLSELFEKATTEAKDLEQNLDKEPAQDPAQDLVKNPVQNQDPSDSEKSEEAGANDIDQGKSGISSNDEEQSMPAQKNTFSPTELAKPFAIDTCDSQISQSSLAGKHAHSDTGKSGSHLRDVPDRSPRNLAVNSTLKHSLARTGGTLQILRQDLHQKQRQTRSANLVLFAVDCSGSMAALKRVELVKGAINELIVNAYQKRDQIAVITFAGRHAKLLLPPTRSSERAEELIAAVETGGRTPLPSALKLVEQLLSTLKKDDGEPLLVLLSDGKANVSMAEGGDAWQETLALAERLREQKLATIVIDTESGFVRLGRAKELAQRLNAEYISIGSLSVESLSFIVRRCLRSRRG